jgi:ATP-dependent phosphofructokinase / diphosphate-dependent phosphofructokinase
MSDRTPDAVRRVCILTGGGDAPGLNAVLRAFVKTGVDLGLDIYGSEDGFEGLIQPGRLVKLKKESVRGIVARGGSILGCSNRANPFSYPTRVEGGAEVLLDVSDRVVRRLRDHGVDTLVLVGGDGTMSMGLRFMQLGVPVVGVPKTIDNDLGCTDVTFGLETAVHTATWAIDALHSTAEAHDRVMILEVMGRDAGFIALLAGMAGGADVVLIPEIPYDVERVAAKVRQRTDNGASFSIVVVGEGARPKDGAVSILTGGQPGHLPRLGGAGETLAQELEGRISHEVRVTVLGHLQRGGSPVARDRMLGTRFGVAAAQLCQQNRTGRMVALQGLSVVDVPLEDAVGQPKRVDPSGELTAACRAMGIELGG